MKKLIILMITFIVTMSPVLASTQISSRISQSSDDAEESISSGSMDISGSDLELVDDQVIGMRFNNIDIPPGVNIINAYIQFTVDETKGSGSGAILDFHAQAIDSAQTFTSSTYDISSRIKTNMAIQWNVAAWNSVGEASVDQVTPDLSSVIQEIVDRPGWTQFNSIAIIVTGAGTRTAEAFDGESVAAPLLVIEYESGPPECSDGIDNDADGLIDFPSDPECLSEADNDEIDALSTTTISSIISQSSDDAEERSGGSMDLSSSDLELVFDDSNQEVGMRFQNIGIPQAAIITNAYIEFAADETNSVTTNLELFAQDTDNAPTFSSSSNNISNRIKTSASVQWNDIPAWSSVSEKHRSPDISTIIQEVIDRGGWLSGNSIAIIVAGSGERTAEAYDGESQNAALLVIEYTTEQPVYQCADGFDNDGDGLIDMADSGCASFTDTSEFADNECDDGLDNDGDGLIDVADSGCSSFSDTSEFADNECDDGLDNDGDGLTDVADQGCFSASDVSEFADNECDDGFDNDGDGLIDVADSGCASSSDTSEFAGNECDDDLDNDGDGLTDVADPGCSSASDVSEFADNECDDGLDNDGDGLTDIADPGCIDLTGFDETNCGDGICEAEESWQTCPLDCAVPQCSDGIDNDADGLADFPNDPGCLSDTDDNEIDELPTATISSIISQSSDDAEEKSGGSMSLSSSDLELVYDGSNQVVGMRFQNIEIPQAAIITNAYIEFAADETNSITTNLELFAQDTDNAPTFLTSSYDISSRVKTSASVQWSNVPAWNSVSEKHRSPDISLIIQAVIGRSGWLSGNSIVIIVTGTGKRTAESYNGESQNAPLLVIEYTTEAPVSQCADGLDNDGDSLIDMADFGCADASDTSEFADNECDDGLDNDGDGLIDIADQGCIDLTGFDETNCGDGICEAEESEQTCPLDCTEPEFGLLNVTGNNEDLIEGTFTPSNSADLPNLGTQYKRLIHRGGFGTDSVCGLRGEIIKVTNLNDSGSGSLRDAVNQNGPRTIVFEVSGAIKLQSQLEINSPFITIAGQTAPPPGISLYHQVLSVHTHDVCLQHIRVRLGDRDHNLNLISGKEAEVADTVMISGGFDPGGTYNVVLDNMSVSWSIDETISFFDGVSNLTIRDSIIAEPLRLSVHEDDHAYCFFIQDSERVSVIGNLLGHCQRRSLRMDGGTLQYVNNFVYNPGEYAVHVHELPIHVTMVGNVMDFPDDAGNRWNYSGAEEFFASRSPEAKVYFLGNKSFEDRPLHQARDEGLPVVLQSVPRVWEGNVMALTAADVAEWISNWVGAFPLHRDLVDARIIEGVRTHTGTYLDSQMDNGGYVDVEENQRILTLPENPQGDDDNDGISNLVEWLQLYTDAIE
ncbi:hypothetical protein [Psychromonas sp.]|uniref:hypothetical protein n=1 Tax=Psychromonas sp. TaxID=1884585 RepID=UPI00356ADA9F